MMQISQSSEPDTLVGERVRVRRQPGLVTRADVYDACTLFTLADLGHPANGIAWLANSIAAYGASLEAGHVVLPGTCTRAYRLYGRREVKGRIAGLGEVTLTLANEPAVKPKKATR